MTNQQKAIMMTIDTSEYPTSFVVRGNTYLNKDMLKNMGGKWNTALKHGCGWIFNKMHYEKVKAFVEEKNMKNITTLVPPPVVEIPVAPSPDNSFKIKNPKKSVEVEVYKPVSLDAAILQFILEKCSDIQRIIDDNSPLEENRIEVPEFTQEIKELECKGTTSVWPEFQKELEKKLGKGRSGYGNKPQKVWVKGKDLLEKFKTRSLLTAVDVDHHSKQFFFFKKQMMLVEGKTQSGKSNFICSAAINDMRNGLTPIMIVRDLNADMKQLHHSLKRMLYSLVEYLGNQGFDVPSIDASQFIMTGQELGSKKKEQLNYCLGNVNGWVFVICLANSSQLSNLEQITRFHPGKYTMYIDESDFVDYSKEAEKMKPLTSLKEMSYRTFAITATPYDSIFSERGLMASNLVRITPPRDYRGFEDFTYHHLFFPVEYSIQSKYDYEKLKELDKNLSPFLKQFSVGKIYDTTARYKEKHPLVLLLKNSRANETQWAQGVGIAEEFGLVTVVYNGKGIRVNYKNMKPIKISNKTVYPNTDVEVELPDVLQYFKDNGGAKVFPRIVIISGNLAGRGISFVSRDYKWHTTHMYYIPAKTATIADIIQAGGRLCGRNRGIAGLNFYAHEEVINSLFTGYMNQDELISRVVEDVINDSIIQDDEIKIKIKEVPLRTEKMDTKRVLATKANVRKNTFNLVKNGNDGGWEMKEYKCDILDMYGTKPTVPVPVEEPRVVEVESGVLEGNIIPEPKSGTKNREQYDIIVRHLSNMKGKWVSLTELRNLFRENATDSVKIYLHNTPDPTYGNTGLVYRKNGFNLEYGLN